MSSIIYLHSLKIYGIRATKDVHLRLIINILVNKLISYPVVVQIRFDNEVFTN